MLKNQFEQSLYLPFRSEQTIQYEPINWQNESSSAPARFIIQPPTSPNQILHVRNEPNNDNHTNTVVIVDDLDDKNYVDTNGDEENQAPKVVIKKKAKKKKQIPQVNPVETTTDSASVLNTSSNRASTTGYKYPVNKNFRNEFTDIFLSIISSKNYHRNGQLANESLVLELVKQVLFVK